MAQENTGDTMKFEVESRLDDLFGETESTGENEKLDFNNSASNNLLEPGEPEVLELHEEGVEMNEGHPLDELKSTVLSIDWEITDEVMTRFVDQVEGLKREFANSKIHLLFLQLLGSVGVYIKTNRGKADPDAFKVLGSAFKAFDDVVSSNNMPNPEKKKRLAVELEKFKELKKKIAIKKLARKQPVAKTVNAPPKKILEEKKSKPVLKNDHIELVVEASGDDSDNLDDVKEIVLRPADEDRNINSQEIINEVLIEMKKFIRGEFDDLREELRLRKKRR